MPAGEFGCAKSSPVGRTATSKRALEMSTPTNTASPPWLLWNTLQHRPTLRIRARARSTIRAPLEEPARRPTLSRDLQRPRNNRSTVLGSTSNIQGKYGFGPLALRPAHGPRKNKLKVRD